MTAVRRPAPPHRLLKSLVALALVLGLVAGTAGSANAWTVQRFPDHVVLTSKRMSDGPRHATIVVDLRSDGTYGWEVRAHFGWMHWDVELGCTVWLTASRIPLQIITKKVYGGRRSYETLRGEGPIATMWLQDEPRPSALLQQSFAWLQSDFEAECHMV